jgi:hypothetical protein
LTAPVVFDRQARTPVRGWQPLFDKLNQAKAYNYLKQAGCTNIAFTHR